jgi:hypothetical protein
VYASILKIDSPLGVRFTNITKPELLSQEEIAHQALLFAISEEGWSINIDDGWIRKFQYYDEIEWAVTLPASESENFGFPANEDIPLWWNKRWLVFHTDDIIQFNLPYDIGEPSGFGTISGLRNVYKNGLRIFPECVNKYWGTFQIVPEPPPILLLSSIVFFILAYKA